MPKICNVGEDDYSGWDGDRHFNLAPGEEDEVSAEKAAQMVADFPKWFRVKGSEAAKVKSKAKKLSAAEKKAGKAAAAAEKKAATEAAAAAEAAAAEAAASS